LELKRPTTEAIFRDGHDITLADPNPTAIADKIEWLLKNPDERKRIANNAFDYVGQFSWEISARKVETILKRELEKI
jgi:glycosyltransferase involved in cell wall biosynthesis